MDNDYSVIEFNPGENITYKPYETEHPAKVIEIRRGTLASGPDDKRVFYILAGGCQIETTGKCILESRYFEPWKDETHDA